MPKTQKSKSVSAVKYLQFIDCIYGSVNLNEELQNRTPREQEEAYLGLTID